jgi:hypothetical protein
MKGRNKTTIKKNLKKQQHTHTRHNTSAMEWKKNKLDKVKFSQDSGIAALQHNPN